MKNTYLIKSEKAKVKRLPQRGYYDFETISGILDETFVCQVGFSINNKPYVIPTCFGRKDNNIYFHGAKNSRMLKTIKKEGTDICFSLTILDGIVLARSAFHHSINYRSVVLFGNATEVNDDKEKTAALKIISDNIMRDRWDEVRPPNKKELNATSVMCFKIKEGSAKIRTGPPNDEEDDMDLHVWAGVLPFKDLPLEPIADDKLLPDIPVPDYVKNYKN